GLAPCCRRAPAGSNEFFEETPVGIDEGKALSDVAGSEPPTPRHPVMSGELVRRGPRRGHTDPSSGTHQSASPGSKDRDASVLGRAERRRWWWSVPLVALIGLVAITRAQPAPRRPADPPGPSFRDVAAEAGVGFRFDQGS